MNNTKKVIDDVVESLEKITQDLADCEAYIEVTDQTIRDFTEENSELHHFLCDRRAAFSARREELRAKQVMAQAFLDVKKAEAKVPSFFLS